MRESKNNRARKLQLKRVWNSFVRELGAGPVCRSSERDDDESLNKTILKTWCMTSAIKTGKTCFDDYDYWQVVSAGAKEVTDFFSRLGGHVLEISRFGQSLGWAAAVIWPDAAFSINVAHYDDEHKRTKRGRMYKVASRIDAVFEDTDKPKGDGHFGVQLNFFSHNESDPRLKAIREFFESRIYVPKTIDQNIFVLCSGRSGLHLQNAGSLREKFKRENYAPNVVKDFDHVLSDLSRDDPCGKLVLISGPPGTGKTYFVKGLVEACPGVRFVLVPGELVHHLTSPGFADLLLEHSKESPICLIIEDADMLVKQRTDGNMSSVSTMLNLSDGIFGSLTDLRIICTTNASDLDIDQAVLRRRRLCRKIYITVLDEETTAKVYKRLTKEDRTKAGGVTLGDIYDEAWNRNEEKRIAKHAKSRPTPQGTERSADLQ